MNVLRLQKTLAPMLRPFASGYRALMKLRRFFWESGFLARLTPACPCISVGNIAWGGTGKTPLVDWLLSWAKSNNLKSVVLSRGYKADLSIAPVYVKSHHTAHDVGDEPLMLALDHPETAVLVDPNRCRSGRYALQKLQPEVLILDDGMQHLAVQRTLELVLLRPEDVLDEWENGIPAGSWREGASALQRADAFIFKTSPGRMQELFPAIQKRLRVFKRPVFSFSMHPVCLEGVTFKATLMPKNFQGPYALISGVGSPDQVASTVEHFLGEAPEEHLVFSDHHSYTFRDGERFARLNMPLVCTRKDAVKLRLLPLKRLWTIRTVAHFETSLWSSLPFLDWMNEWLQRQTQSESALSTSSEGRKWNGFTPDQGLQTQIHTSPVKESHKVPDEEGASNTSEKEEVEGVPDGEVLEKSSDIQDIERQPAGIDESPGGEPQEAETVSVTGVPTAPVASEVPATSVSPEKIDRPGEQEKIPPAQTSPSPKPAQSEKSLPPLRSTVPGVLLGMSSEKKK